MDWFYNCAKFVIGIYMHLFFRITVEGKEYIPKDGAAIICSNHISVYDPMVLGVVLERKTCFIAKKELYRNPFFAFVLRALHTIPVDRAKSDVASYRAVLAKLNEGKVIGLFAQGGRVKKGEQKAARAGVAMFALKSGAPVIPTKIVSKYRWFGKIKICHGLPMTFEEYQGVKVKSDVLNEIAEKIMAESDKLINEASI